MTSFAKAFEPSSRAAAPLGPNAVMPSAPSASTRPLTSGASGPTTTRSTCSARARATMPGTSSTPTSTTRASRAMPALPGAHSTSGSRGERRSARTRACSRPPDPTTRIFSGLQRRDEVVDRDRDHRLVLDRPSRAELERHARHRLLVRRLDDVHEVVLAERRPLGLDLGPELLDLTVDLFDLLRVVLDRLDALGRQGREHDVGGHGPVLSERTGPREHLQGDRRRVD